MSLNSHPDQKVANKSLRNNDYFKITKNLVNIYSNNRKVFTENIEKLNVENPELAKIYKSVDSKIIAFVEKMGTVTGAKEIVTSGGYELNLELLAASIESEMGVSLKSKKKKVV